VALCTGWLLSLANAGDSACMLDTGSRVLDMTHTHRIHACKREQQRLREANQVGLQSPRSYIGTSSSYNANAFLSYGAWPPENKNWKSI
jgi:hypothetical protein